MMSGNTSSTFTNLPLLPRDYFGCVVGVVSICSRILSARLIAIFFRNSIEKTGTELEMRTAK